MCAVTLVAADDGDLISCANPLTHGMTQALVIAIKTHITATVIDDHEAAQITEPIRVDDGPGSDRADGGTRLGFDQNAGLLGAAFVQGAAGRSGHRTSCWPGERSFEFREVDRRPAELIEGPELLDEFE